MEHSIRGIKQKEDCSIYAENVSSLSAQVIDSVTIINYRIMIFRFSELICLTLILNRSFKKLFNFNLFTKKATQFYFMIQKSLNY